METIGDRVKALVTSVGGSPPRRERSSVRKVLDERMTLSEAIEAATQIVDGYPNGGRDAGKSYIGALAAMLASYPRQIALRCADRIHGVIRDCRYLPTPADIVTWCESRTEALRQQDDREQRVAAQLAQRDAYVRQETTERPKRLSIAELKAKYGDWHHEWKPPGQHQRELAQVARRQLIAQIGQEAFDALPEAKRC